MHKLRPLLVVFLLFLAVTPALAQPRATGHAAALLRLSLARAAALRRGPGQ